MLHRYSPALKIYEKIIKTNAGNIEIKRKSLISYIAVGKSEEAFRIFSEIVNENPYQIINIKFENPECPCPSLIADFKTGKLKANNNYEENLSLGMLWLFCDLNNSLKHFYVTQKINNADPRISKVIDKLNELSN